MHHPWFQWWAFCFQWGTKFFYFDYRHTKLLNFHKSCWLYFLHFFQWRKPSLREVMLTWSRAHNLSKKELGLQPSIQWHQRSVSFPCILLPSKTHPPLHNSGSNREYHWGLLLWQLFLSSYQLSPATFVLRVEAGPVHLPTSLFLRTDRSWDSSSNFSLAKSEPNESCPNHIRVGFFLSFSFFCFSLSQIEAEWMGSWQPHHIYYVLIII